MDKVGVFLGLFYEDLPLSLRRALISVADKTSLATLAHTLHQQQIELIATGGTSKYLKQHNIPYIDVATLTGYPEILGGRVKTLHPKIHGAILAQREFNQAEIQQLDLALIDLVIVNLYPFAQTINRDDCNLAEAVEQIDIGGVALLRAAAKNFKDVTVICDPDDYTMLIEQLQNNEPLLEKTRQQLAAKAFQHTANYDSLIANYLSDTSAPALSAYVAQQNLRYGENPHQQAVLYYNQMTPGTGIAQAQLLQGKALSYNNLIDADAAWLAVNSLQATGCVIVKHATPCGAANAENQLEAYQKAFACDAQSAFGGIIAFNRELSALTAQAIIQQQFAEVIIAPHITTDALTILQQKSNLRVLAASLDYKNPWEIKSISGGIVAQTRDSFDDATQWSVATMTQPTASQLQDLNFAWTLVKHVKSNAILLAKDGQTLGIGTGQTSRVFSTEIALLKAKHAGLSVANAVLASDAFFPFADSVEIAAQAGIGAIIQPGGSKRDPEVIAKCNEYGIAMLFTHTRHFRH